MNISVRALRISDGAVEEKKGQFGFRKYMDFREPRGASTPRYASKESFGAPRVIALGRASAPREEETGRAA